MALVPQFISLTPDDITHNDAGQFSPAQMKRLQGQRLAYLIGTATFILLFFTILILLILKILSPAFASRGELFVIIPIILFWLWLLRRTPSQLRHIQRDLKEGQIARLEGLAHCEWTNSFGLIQFPKYALEVSGDSFAINKQEFFQFTNRQSYQVFYSPHAKTFLGAVAATELSQPTPVEPPPNVAQAVLAEPLTAQELKLLQLAANGLSNKEIAAQLSLSVNTVKMYSSQIYRKLGVSRRTEAIAVARKHGLL